MEEGYMFPVMSTYKYAANMLWKMGSAQKNKVVTRIQASFQQEKYSVNSAK